MKYLAKAARASRPPLSAIFLSGLLDRGRDAAGKAKPNALSSGIEPVNEFFAGENGSSGDGVVRFGLGSLVEYDAAAPLRQGSLKRANVSKFVGKGARTFRAERAKILDDARVSPSEQAVEIADLQKKRVVAVGSNGNNACATPDLRMAAARSRMRLSDAMRLLSVIPISWNSRAKSRST